MSSVTIKDIARICGVGVSTVSRAINNHADINEATKQRIMTAIEEHNYIPNNSARNLKRIEGKAIAVLVKGISNPFFADMIKVIEKEVKRKKYTLILQHVEFSEDEVDVALELIKEKRLTGLIFLGGYFTHTQEQLNKISVPFIISSVGTTKEQGSHLNYSTISVDDVAESKKIVDYLFSIGHEKIAIICADEMDESIGKLRFDGYMKAYRERNIEPKSQWIYRMKEDIETYSFENGYACALDILESEENFTAIYAISDMLAIGACKALVTNGKKIPEDYSLVGFDGIKLSEYYNPSITSLVQPVEAMAYETIKLLFKLISKKKDHVQMVFEGELVIRESVSSV